MEFKDRDLEAFWKDPDRNPPRRVPPQLRRIVYRKLQMLDAAADLRDLRVPPSNRLAKAIHKPQSAISDIVHGRRAISTEMAWLLSRALGTTPEFWLNLEKTYQLKTFNEASLPPVLALA